MHATLTTTEGPTEDLAAIATMVGEEMVRWTRHLKGFLGLILLGAEETGRVRVLSLWESCEIAESHLPARLRFRDRISATVGAQVVETESYEVLFAEVPGLQGALGPPEP